MGNPQFNPIKDVDGTLALDIVTADGVNRLRTAAPFAEVAITIDPTYNDEGREMEFGLGHIWHPPTLRHIDLTVRVRMLANSTPDGVLYRMMTPEAETIEQTVRRVIADTKMLSPRSRLARMVIADELMAALKERGHA